MAVDIPTVLSMLRMESDEELAPVFFTMEDQWERKLWFQLTETLVELYRDERSQPVRKKLFDRFVSTFSGHINQLAYVSLGITAGSNLSPQEALTFFNEIAKAVDKDSTRDAHVYAEMRIAAIYVQLRDAAAAKKILDQATRAVDELQISDPVISAAYYGTLCEYYKSRAEYTNYYRSALLYLAVVDLDALPSIQQRQRAYDLAIAAMLGDKIYNFGELVLHPVLERLEGENAWLRRLVETTNNGNIAGFQALRPDMQRNSLLSSSIPFLEQKICLMALVECVFQRKTTERVLSFAEVAKETHLTAGSKVEILVMKAFSIGLLRGSIDQVSQTVKITWVQPRVLNKDQMAHMAKQLDAWGQDVEGVGVWMQAEGSGVWRAA